MRIKGQYQRFISAEPATLPFDNAKECVLLSFGDEDGPIVNLIVNLDDARDMVAGMIAALAAHGDQTAQQIACLFFSTPEEE